MLSWLTLVQLPRLDHAKLMPYVSCLVSRPAWEPACTSTSGIHCTACCHVGPCGTRAIKFEDRAIDLRDRILDTGIGLVDRVFDKRLFQQWRMPPHKWYKNNKIMRRSKKRERHVRTGAEETHHRNLLLLLQGSQGPWSSRKQRTCKYTAEGDREAQRSAARVSMMMWRRCINRNASIDCGRYCAEVPFHNRGWYSAVSVHPDPAQTRRQWHCRCLTAVLVVACTPAHTSSA